MKLIPPVRGAACLAFALATGLAYATPSAAATAVTVDPPVPHPDNQPCVLPLFQDAVIKGDGGQYYPYAPPANCPGPWAKVILKIDVTSSRGAMARVLQLQLDDVVLYQALASRSDAPVSWHAERDLTDDSALLAKSGDEVLVRDFVEDGADQVSEPTASAQLLFYPATAQAPAPHTPDVVVGYTWDSPSFYSLPHNVERAYLDVYNAGYGDFDCVTDEASRQYPALLSPIAPGDNPYIHITQPSQGCAGGSFRQLLVDLDGTPVASVPWFPMMRADQHAYLHNFLDEPAPAPQIANILPYRADLSPFASVLSAGTGHRLDFPGHSATDNPIYATLLLYLDDGQAQVTGAVTSNTLATGSAVPEVRDTLASSGDTLQGQLRTHATRTYQTAGYVDTSHGRVSTQVTQTDYFDDTQTFHLDGLTFPYLRSYRQDVELHTGAYRQSRRYQDGTLLSDEREQVAYPLQWHYLMNGRGEHDENGDADYVWPVSAETGLKQRREIVRVHTPAGQASQFTYLDEVFDAQRNRTIEPAIADTLWQSSRDYTYMDSRGSCYQSSLETRDGRVVSTQTGADCPAGNQTMRWFAHPDGSADNLDWAP